MKIALELNGAKRTVEAPPMTRLLDLVREHLGATGTKEGCGEGECGACTVLIDGRAVNSCLVPSCQVDGARVVTVEGLARSGRLSRLQQAFLDCGAAQCGICTPGMLVAASALPDGATREQIRVGLAGNLCRCTGYVKIYDAVERALAKPAQAAAKAAKQPAKRATKKPAQAAAKAAKKPAKRGAKPRRPAAKRRPSRKR
jgi:carbon-monoxide dehydrogenase small subunit